MSYTWFGVPLLHLYFSDNNLVVNSLLKFKAKEAKHGTYLLQESEVNLVSPGKLENGNAKASVFWFCENVSGEVGEDEYKKACLVAVEGVAAAQWGASPPPQTTIKL